ncbi:hypothetical protein DVB69_09485 [Sporosarcina sp. BI001-red]|uniref:hypothetical protein n=1 Tax=Sporosarcina sp. BI001-red TaxID=2282866 RepID=UPI000E2263A1|nr:hypothetical protein [Sporosarcina sp. BI001-red]REB07081.1 hypothetical protein DVB69_09485 [Sporosarcina sp. BI001-red]
MKKIFILMVAIGLTLAGCSQRQVNKSEDAQIEKTTEIKSETLATTKVISLDLNGVEDREVFSKAVNDSKQEPGIVNMTNPDYKFSIGEESYLLWITSDSGTIMSTKDTHTIYTLTTNSVKEVYGIVNNG